MNNIIHVHNQLRKRYYPAASENAEDSLKKRIKKENKRKSKKRKQETLVRNNRALASLITGGAAKERFSVPNPSKIRKTELTALNTKTLTPRKLYELLKYLLENNYFHEDATECILSILSVLEVTKIQSKASVKYEKSSKTPKNFLKGQKSLFDIFQTEKSEDKNFFENVTTLRMLLFSMTVVRRVMEIISLAVTQKVAKMIAKTESNIFRSYTPPPPPHFHCFPSTTTTTTTFLLFFPPPPPPHHHHHFYCFPSSSPFLLFFPPPHFYCFLSFAHSFHFFFSTRFYKRLPTAIFSSF